MGENAFDSSIPPFLNLHLVFNVELFQPYFPPLLDTLDVTEHLSSPPNYNEQVIVDQIMDAMIKETFQHNIQLKVFHCFSIINKHSSLVVTQFGGM